MEAQHYQIKFGGRIFSLQESHMDQLDDMEEDLTVGEFYAKYGEFEVNMEHFGEIIHILVIDKTANLVDGYRTIKEQIYNNMSIFMFDLYNKVIDAGIKPKGIKTDRNKIISCLRCGTTNNIISCSGICWATHIIT